MTVEIAAAFLMIYLFILCEKWIKHFVIIGIVPIVYLALFITAKRGFIVTLIFSESETQLNAY